jgi:hypothetical protein
MAVLERVDDALQQYQSDNRGSSPLYILVSSFESQQLWDEIRRKEKMKEGTTMTTYKGSKVVENINLKKGELRLSNELPESGS